MSDNQVLKECDSWEPFKVLKPCPYCGGQAYMEREGTAKRLCTISCQSCGAKLVTYEEGEACGDLWNMRREVTPPVVLDNLGVVKTVLRDAQEDIRVVFGESSVQWHRMHNARRLLDDAMTMITPKPEEREVKFTFRVVEGS